MVKLIFFIGNPTQSSRVLPHQLIMHLFTMFCFFIVAFHYAADCKKVVARSLTNTYIQAKHCTKTIQAQTRIACSINCY